MNSSQILVQYNQGLITDAEATAALDALKLRGYFKRGNFDGYDYNQQRWVKISAAGVVTYR